MSTARCGPSGIEAILYDLVDKHLLPSEKSDRPDKKACLRTYGMLRSFFNKALTSADPVVEYKEMLETESTLRQRLRALNPNKNIPQEVVHHLDELRAAITEMISLGSDGVVELHRDEEAEKAANREQGIEELVRERSPPIRMVPVTTLAKVRDQLKEEKEKNSRLNAENNLLATELKRMTSERDQLLRSLGRR